jgi:hypothetical protein
MATPNGKAAGGREIEMTETQPGKVEPSKSFWDTVSSAARFAITGRAPDGWFGPSKPMPPVAPDESKGRAFDYPFAVNMTYLPRGETGENLINFTTLRRMADPLLGGLDLMRLAIETRKDQMAGQQWTIKLRDDQGNGGEKARAIKAALRRPDGVTPFRVWQRALLEDLLVIDAPAIYINRTRGKPNLPSSIEDEPDVMGVPGALGGKVPGQGGPPPFGQPTQDDEGAIEGGLDGQGDGQEQGAGEAGGPPGEAGAEGDQGRPLGAPRGPAGQAGAPAEGKDDHWSFGGEPPAGDAPASGSLAAPRDASARDARAEPTGGTGSDAGSSNGDPAQPEKKPNPFAARKLSIGEDIAKAAGRFPGGPKREGPAVADGRDAGAQPGAGVRAEGSQRDGEPPSEGGEGTPPSPGARPGSPASGDREARAGEKQDAPTGDKPFGPADEEGGDEKPRLGPDGKPLPPAKPRLGPDGKPLPPEEPKLGPDGAPLPPADFKPRLDAQGKPLLDPDGNPMAKKPIKIATHTADEVGVLLEVVDGATLKRLLREDGRTPRPPDPAFVQNLKGMPAFQYTTDEVVYSPRNVRSNRIYGQSPVEQVVTTVDIALRRQMSQGEYYTAGSIPDMIMGVPETWTPAQVAEFQTYWDTILSGDTEARRRMRFVPGGIKPIPTKEPILKDMFDEWLARLICYAFSLSPQALVAQMNRATAETAEKQALSEGLEPLKLWWKDVMDTILATAFDAPEMEFAYEDEEISDPKIKSDVWCALTAAGIATKNEARDAYGWEPIEGLDDPPPPPMNPFGGPPGVPGSSGPPSPPQGGPGGPPPPFGAKPNPFGGGKPGAPPFGKPTGAPPFGAKGGSPFGGKPAGGAPPFGAKKPNPFAKLQHEGDYTTLENGDVVFRSKDRLLWLAKGDIPGHEFRGNQYSDGGSAPAPEGPRDYAEEMRQYKAARSARKPDQHEAAAEYSRGQAERAERGNDEQAATHHRTIEAKHRLAAEALRQKHPSARAHSQAAREASRSKASYKADLDLDVLKGGRGTRGPRKRPGHAVPRLTALEEVIAGRLNVFFAEYLARLAQELGVEVEKAEGITITAADIDRLRTVVTQEDLDSLIAAIQGDLGDTVKLAAEAALKQLRSQGVLSVGVAIDLVHQRAAEWATLHAGNMITGITNTMQDGVQRMVEAAIEDEATVAQLREALYTNPLFHGPRAEMIARTELAIANVAGNLIAWEDSGVVEGVRWATGADCCPKCDEMDGEEVPLGSLFDYDGDQIEGPPAHPNCRCAVIPILVDDPQAADEGGVGFDAEKVAKGDVDGHPFRGNQYTDGGGSLPDVVYRGSAGGNEQVSSSFPQGVYVSTDRASAGQWGDTKAYGVHRQPRLLDLGDWNAPGAKAIVGYATGVDPASMSRTDFDDLAAEVFIQGNDRAIARLKAKGWDGMRFGKDAFLIGTLDAYARAGVKKGDFAGHPFRGNQFSDGTGGGAAGGASLPDNKVRPHERSRADRERMADALAAMPEAKRDNIDHFDFGYDAFLLYEARVKMPKKEGAIRGVSMSNSDFLYQECDAVANIDGKPHLAIKEEDPDNAEDVDEESAGKVWAFQDPADGPSAKRFETSTFDKEEAVQQYKAHLASKAQPADPVDDAFDRHPAMMDVPVATIERWYDRHSRNWVVQRKDAEGNETHSADYVGSKAEADQIVAARLKDHPKASRIGKGDSDGHPFRGNQWTDGTGGGGDEDDAGTSRDTTAEAEDRRGTMSLDYWREKADAALAADSKDNNVGTVKDKWARMSVRDRDTLADPETTVPARMEELLGDRERPSTGDGRADSIARVMQYADQMHEKSIETAATMVGGLHDELIQAGVHPEVAARLTMAASDHLIAQEFEAQSRTLGDHGIHHLNGDAEMAKDILKVLPGNQNTPENRVAVTLAAVYHDTGYLTPPSRMFLDGDHPRWSTQYAEDALIPDVKEAFGAHGAQQVRALIAGHDWAGIDFANEPVGTAFAVADNMALFAKEKTPPLLRSVPESIKTLTQFAQKKIDRATCVKTIREQIGARGDLSSEVKARFTKAAGEITGMLPKMTLGMVGAKMDGFSWEEDHLTVHATRYRANEELGKVLDLNQKQFEKMAKTYGADPKALIEKGQTDFSSKDGRVLLRMTLTNATNKGGEVYGFAEDGYVVNVRVDRDAIEKALRGNEGAIVKAVRRSIDWVAKGWVGKGDAEGHPFRGNQHTDGASGGDRWDGKGAPFRAAGFRQKSTGKIVATGASHDILSVPDWTEDDWEDGFVTHSGAFKTREEASEYVGQGRRGDFASEALPWGREAIREEQDRMDARRGKEFTDADRDVVVRHRDALTLRGPWAKAKVRKGDAPGHPFRGNQYTSGGGKEGGEKFQTTMEAMADRLVEARAKTGGFLTEKDRAEARTEAAQIASIEALPGSKLGAQIQAMAEADAASGWDPDSGEDPPSLRPDRNEAAKTGKPVPLPDDFKQMSSMEQAWLKGLKQKDGVRSDADLDGQPMTADEVRDAIAPMASVGALAKYVLKAGKAMDVPTRAPNIKLGAPKECFMNATKLMMDDPSKYEYTEGYMVSARVPFPVHHAWVVDKATGEVVDPTLGWVPGAGYFGIRISTKDVYKSMSETKYYGVLTDGRNGGFSPFVMRAEGIVAPKRKGKK